MRRAEQKVGEQDRGGGRYSAGQGDQRSQWEPKVKQAERAIGGKNKTMCQNKAGKFKCRHL